MGVFIIQYSFRVTCIFFCIFRCNKYRKFSIFLLCTIQTHMHTHSHSFAHSPSLSLFVSLFLYFFFLSLSHSFFLKLSIRNIFPKLIKVIMRLNGTSHLTITLSLFLYLWQMIKIYSFDWINNAEHVFANLVPQGIPPVHIPFETTRNIHPGTVVLRRSHTDRYLST